MPSDTLPSYAPRLPKKRSGLSRVDVAVLAACFSVLAMVAVPRHLGLSAGARGDEVRALARGVGSAAALANAYWHARHQPAALSLAGGDAAVVNGYPSAATVQRALEPAEWTQFDFAAGRWQHRDAPGPCGVVYQPPPQPGQPPLVRVIADGC